MGIYELYSKRQKKLRGEGPDVYVYDQFPKAFRVQLVHIVRENLGTEQEHYDGLTATGRAYKEIVMILRKEYGLFVLPGPHTRTPVEII